MGKIFEALSSLKLTSDETRKVISNGTRDKVDLTVWQDTVSQVIFIDDFYVGDEEYTLGTYRAKDRLDYERYIDKERRLKDFLPYFVGKRICDFGCGAGDFLIGARPHAMSVEGVELQEDYRLSLEEQGINCLDNIADADKNFDSVMMFHSFEHMNDPLYILKQIRSKTVDGGKILIEVPHANDYLIKYLQCKPFIDFTLWSQHLILHTRESLKCFLEVAGYKNIMVTSFQRYPLSNHLNWLAKGEAGGHKSLLNTIDTPELISAYESALRKIDATDTLVAIAEK